MEAIPDWFWSALAAARPSLAALEAWLEAQPREVVERFAAAYDAAAGELVDDYSDGVEVDGIVWSEDSAEDLCAWVVGQGRDFWGRVVDGTWSLAEVADAYLDRPSPLGAAAVRWDTAVSHPDHRGYQAPWAIAYGVYRTRFGEELTEA
ncbi:hypothetical protein [Dactylosporangium salmoneum]|uniref:DUF4240 domain-containing protein n=1 Tax=Dactylosporangium salmoneum TaxID=53361 RepID=A0ABN3FFZ4_9ACTN